MNARDTLLALIEAGGVLSADGARLRFRAPQGALPADLRAGVAGCRGELAALVRGGAVLPPDQADWPKDARDHREERAAIMEFDGGLPRRDAEFEAERCVRLEYALAFLARSAPRSTP